MSPVMIFDGPVVLLHAKGPSTYNLIKSIMMNSQTKNTMWTNLVWNWEFIDEIKVQEHSYNNLESFAFLIESVIELVAVEVELPGNGNSFSCQPLCVVVSGCGVVGQTVKCHSLIIQMHLKYHEQLDLYIFHEKFLFTCFAINLHVLS